MKTEQTGAVVAYTAGPWNTDGNSVSVFAGDGPDRQKICDTAWVTINVKDARANARLIAAAPELLEALKQIAIMPELANAGMGSDAYHAWIIAGQAIAKATGGKP